MAVVRKLFLSILCLTLAAAPIPLTSNRASAQLAEAGLIASGPVGWATAIGAASIGAVLYATCPPVHRAIDSSTADFNQRASEYFSSLREAVVKGGTRMNEQLAMVNHAEASAFQTIAFSDATTVGHSCPLQTVSLDSRVLNAQLMLLWAAAGLLEPKVLNDENALLKRMEALHADAAFSTQIEKIQASLEESSEGSRPTTQADDIREAARQAALKEMWDVCSKMLGNQRLLVLLTGAGFGLLSYWNFASRDSDTRVIDYDRKRILFTTIDGLVAVVVPVLGLNFLGDVAAACAKGNVAEATRLLDRWRFAAHTYSTALAASALFETGYYLGQRNSR